MQICAAKLAKFIVPAACIVMAFYAQNAFAAGARCPLPKNTPHSLPSSQLQFSATPMVKNYCKVPGY